MRLLCSSVAFLFAIVLRSQPASIPESLDVPQLLDYYRVSHAGNSFGFKGELV